MVYHGGVAPVGPAGKGEGVTVWGGVGVSRLFLFFRVWVKGKLARHGKREARLQP